MTPEALNQSESIEFMYDALVCNRCFRTFNVVVHFNRETMVIEIDPEYSGTVGSPDTGQNNGKPWISAETADGQQHGAGFAVACTVG
ncbi:hypothetical protein ACR9GP_26895 [Enterobacter ludwigii]